MTEVVELEDGTLGNALVAMKENVNQTLGQDEAEFRAMGLPSRDNPACKPAS